MKGMGLKKGLSAVLCGILLVTSIGLSDLGSMKAYATEPTALTDFTFKLTLPYTPVCGDNISDHDCTGQTVEVTSHSNCTAKIVDVWNTNDEKFVGGKVYQVEVEIIANEEFYFPKSCTDFVKVNATKDNGTSAYCGLGPFWDPTDDWGSDKRSSIFVWANFYCEGSPITVSFDGGTGSGSMPPVEKKEGDTYFFPSCSFNPPEGYKFIGWSVNDPYMTSGNYLYQPDDSIKLYENTTLYAQYAPKNKYALTINCDPYQGQIIVTDGMGNALDPSAIPEGTYIRLQAIPTSGWKLGASSTSWDYYVNYIGTPTNEYLNLRMPDSSMKVGYTFEKDPDARTITLDAKGGSVSPSFIMTNKEGKLKLPNGNLITLPTPTLSGKTFKYWATSDGVKYNESATYTEDTTLFAVYEDSLTPDPNPDPKPDPNPDPKPGPKPDPKPDPTPGGAPEPAPAPIENVLLPFDLAAELIDAAKAGDTVTYDFGGWHSFPLYLMEKVASRPDLTYVFKCVYESDYYEFTIKPGTKFELNCLWYGPLKMAELFDTKITDAEGKAKSAVKGNPTAGNGVYIIQRGDTLSKLAAQFKRTIEELLRLNSDITDRDYIVAGKNLNY